MAPVPSDLLFRPRGPSGKLEEIPLTNCNRLRGTWEAKGPTPRLGQEYRAQGIVTARRDSRWALCTAPCSRGCTVCTRGSGAGGVLGGTVRQQGYLGGIPARLLPARGEKRRDEEKTPPSHLTLRKEKRRGVIASLCLLFLRLREDSSPRYFFSPGPRKRTHRLTSSRTSSGVPKLLEASWPPSHPIFCSDHEDHPGS